MGALDEDPGIRPSAHQFVDYAAPWDRLPDDGLPVFPSGCRPASGRLTAEKASAAWRSA
jgi:hypothetical protein